MVMKIPEETFCETVTATLYFSSVTVDTINMNFLCNICNTIVEKSFQKLRRLSRNKIKKS